MAKINELVDQKQFPAISIIVPTHPQYPDFKADQLHLKDLLDEVKEQLSNQYSKMKTDVMLGKLRALIDGIDFKSLSKGLAIYVSPEVEKVIYLPFEVSSEKVIVDESFEVRDLIYTAKKNKTFLLVMISKNKVKTFMGDNSTLKEIMFPDMPLNVVDVTNEHSRPGLPYFDIDAYEEKNIRNYVRLIDDEIEKALRKKEYPIILMSDQKELGYLKEHSRNKKRIVGYIEGNYEHANYDELKKRIAPVLEQLEAADEEKALLLLAGAVNTDNYAAGIAEVWRAAAEARGRLLLVEKDYKQPARFGDDKFTIIIDDEVNNVRDRIADGVDDIIELVLKNKGDVIFLENGLLKDYERIALVTRY